MAKYLIWFIMLNGLWKKSNVKADTIYPNINDQGWGGPAVQYRQSTPVLRNLGPVTDWRSTFCGPGLDRECQSYE